MPDQTVQPHDTTGISPGRQMTRGFLIAVIALLVLAGAACFIDQRVIDTLTAPDVRKRLGFGVRLIQGASGFIVFMIILSHFRNGKRLCIGFITALLLATFITHTMKAAIGRARPETDLGIAHFDAWTFDGKFESFPSGHSSASAVLAILLGFYFPRARWLFYFLAMLNGLERIYADKHFLSDVFAGFAVGIFAVWICVRVLGWQYYTRGADVLSSAGEGGAGD